MATIFGKRALKKQPEEHFITFDDSEKPIMVTEVQNAINKSKNGKAESPDELPTELYKTLTNSTCITRLTELFNTIYDIGHIPNDWLQSTFVVIPKKPNAKKCNEYRTISLMSHTLKIFLKIIHGRIYKKEEKQMSQEQFGFRRDLELEKLYLAYKYWINDVVKSIKKYICV